MYGDSLTTEWGRKEDPPRYIARLKQGISVGTSVSGKGMSLAFSVVKIDLGTSFLPHKKA